MPASIQETIVTPGTDEDVVQIYISDQKRDDEAAEIVLRFHVSIQHFRSPVFAQLQRAALAKGVSEAQRILKELDADLQWLDLPRDVAKRSET